MGTAIYFLVTAGSPSRLHRIDADEIFHWYAGDAVEQLQVVAGGDAEVWAIGPDVSLGQAPQMLVPAGAWQGLRVMTTDGWALLGCTVSPGFEFDGFELASASDVRALVERFPARQRLIEALA